MLYFFCNITVVGAANRAWYFVFVIECLEIEVFLCRILMYLCTWIHNNKSHERSKIFNWIIFQSQFQLLSFNRLNSFISIFLFSCTIFSQLFFIKTIWNIFFLLLLLLLYGILNYGHISFYYYFLAFKNFECQKRRKNKNKKKQHTRKKYLRKLFFLSFFYCFYLSL